MTETQFNQLAAEGYNRIPLVLETFADLDTPLSVYLKLANQPHTYLLESVVGGERFGRYSFIGLAGRHAHRSARTTMQRIRARQARTTARATTIRCSSSQQYQRAFKAAPQPDCRASAAGSSAISATTPCATSSGGSPACSKPDRARRARHSAAALRGARDRRQSFGQAVPGRLRRPARDRRLSSRRTSG